MLLQPCGNPDCLYLHEIGSQEDSFTKDEIVSAYTRYFYIWLHSAMYFPDCRFMHKIVIQEDSFTKDAIISAYTSYFYSWLHSFSPIVSFCHIVLACYFIFFTCVHLHAISSPAFLIWLTFHTLSMF